MDEARTPSAGAPGFAVREEKRARCGNDVGRVPALVNYLFSGLESVPGDEALLRLGLQEILINAVEHGNLGIGGTEKERLLESGTYMAELQRRAAAANRAGRRVDVALSNSADGLRITVSDMGAGFDFAAFLAGSDEPAHLGEHGHGIAIARKAFDRLEYAAPGNRVTLLRRAAGIRPGLAGEREFDVEMDLAARFQRSLLPRPEALQNLGELGAVYCFEPLQRVSGDFFDVRRLDDGIFGLFIADISGHGMAAALISSMLKVFFSLYARDQLSPQLLFEVLNGEFFEYLNGGEFLTSFYGIYFARERRFVYANANHPPPLLLRRDGRLETLDADGFFVGVFREARFQETECRLQAGDRLLFYTDGATERCGVPHLGAALAASAAQPPAAALAAIRAAVHDPNHRLDDDLTLLLVEVG